MCAGNQTARRRHAGHRTTAHIGGVVRFGTRRSAEPFAVVLSCAGCACAGGSKRGWLPNGVTVPGMTDSHAADRLLVRSRSHQVWCLIVAAACLAMVVGFVVVGAGEAHPAAQFVAAVCFALLAGAALRWAFTCALFDYAAGVLEVRNPMRVHVVPLPQVHGFEAVRSWVPGGNGQIRLLAKVTRLDGSRLTVVGACAYGASNVSGMVGELNAGFARRDLTSRGSP